MIVRPEVPADLGALHRVVAAAFGREAEAALVDNLRVSKAWIDGLSWVALDEGLMVGHALISRVEIDDAPALSLAPVSVLPSHQRLGFGTAVVRAAVEAAKGTGLPLIVVLGDPGYYGRFGFEPAIDYNIAAPYPGVGNAFQVLPLPSYSGEPQGVVRYPPPFDNL